MFAAEVCLVHSHADTGEVRPIAEAIAKAGFSTVLLNDESVHTMGGDRAITALVTGASCVVVFWSMSSVESQPVLKAAAAAESLEKLVQVRLDFTKSNNKVIDRFSGAVLNFATWTGQLAHPAWRALLYGLISRVDSHLTRDNQVSEARRLEHEAYEQVKAELTEATDRVTTLEAELQTVRAATGASLVADTETRVFISWAGERGLRAAKALQTWLGQVLPDIEPWVSDLDISAGQRWTEALERALRLSRFGIIVVTPESVSANWVAFEAGVLFHAIQRDAICPWLVDVNTIAGPLAQFQAKRADADSTGALVRAINALTAVPVDERDLAEKIGFSWPWLRDKLEEIRATLPLPDGAV